MNIHVFTDHINITSIEAINKNEYNAHPCIFNFESEYDGLVKKALFENEEGLFYEMLITNNKCQIPTEVLVHAGTVKIGVYGYKSTNDTLELRYSPKPVTFEVIEGSYKEGAENSSTPTPTELEQVLQRLQEIEDSIDVFVTEDDVEDMIDEVYTSVMEGEY